MKCPNCGHEEDKVVDSRPSQDNSAIRRRRECLKCHERFTTYEYVEQGTLTVVKTDNTREPYDPYKLLYGIKLACNKRPVSIKEIETMVADIETQVKGKNKSEVTSQEIGEMVMEKLRSADEIAYVRFASVYRKFKDKAEFLEEMKKLLE
ncbi:MAG: transcriptional repressor NrdR [Calditrichaeota bacterium]|nr:MAG: transcriptional repressor NrdR [Calditrichota bacterium]